MKKHYLTFYTIIFIISGFYSGISQASDAYYTPTRITEKIQILYGPLGVPDSKNRGFRSNVVIISTNKGVVLLDSGGSAYAGERVIEAVKK